MFYMMYEVCELLVADKKLLFDKICHLKLFPKKFKD